MIDTVLYGFTIGAILYLVSIGLSLTFGTMKVINFAHGIVYALGVYFFISAYKVLPNFILAALAGLVLVIPLSYVIERFVIRRLYGESLDYAIIATYAVLLMGTDIIKLIWGATPYPVSDPVGISLAFLDTILPLYRVLICIGALAIFFLINIFFKKTLVGKIVVAALDDLEGVRCMGINAHKYFSIIFVLGSALAALGGILYVPISSAHPYMGFSILLLSFAVVIVGGMGNLRGTFYSAFVLGMVIAVTGRFWSQAAETMVFIVMAAVLFFRPMDA